MRRTILTAMLAFVTMASYAQTQTVIVGDMNGDGELTVEDVSLLTSTILGETDTQTMECVVPKETHEYIDLGLPSGTLWATCNIGAENPEDYGYYFAWGEVKPKSTYNWLTLKYCVDSDGDKFSKYVENSVYGNVDNKTELDNDDDAAYVNWGEGWRMPSLEQIQELDNTNNVKKEWVTRNGKSGCLIISKSNGACIFIPSAGYRYEDSIKYAGSWGYYWSRSLNAYNYGANSMFFDSGTNFGWTRNYRCLGFQVRPVRSSASE